MTATKLGRNLI